MPEPVLALDEALVLPAALLLVAELLPLVVVPLALVEPVDSVLEEPPPLVVGASPPPPLVTPGPWAALPP